MEVRRATVCSACLWRATRVAVASAVARQWTSRSCSSDYCGRALLQARRPPTARPQQMRSLATASAQPPPPPPHQTPDVNTIHHRTEELCKSVLRPEDGRLPSEERILYVLEQLEYLARLVLDEGAAQQSASRPTPASQAAPKETATSALLGSVNAGAYPAFMTKASVLKRVSERAQEMVRHADVFISAAVLKAYVRLQSLLRQPSSFPDVFDLYARKAIPVQKGDRITHASASPGQIKSAVPSATAEAALNAAIDAHDLPLAMDIVSTSYCTPAFKKAKVFRQAAFPLVGLGVAPIAALTLSSTFANLQQTMDTGMATGIAFAGTMTYVGAVAMTGYVAVTTANDQMDRVVWATGVPLWERWTREEERAAIDRIAGAWGFKERHKRGEEEGEEWEALREWIGSRGMVLDKVSLMDGME